MSSFDSTLSNLTPLCSVDFRKTHATFRATARASAYGTTSWTPSTSSRPPPSRASPSNVIDSGEINDTTGENGNGAEAPATSTSARRCRSVASALTQPSRPLDPFAAPNYSQSAYAGSSKRKGGPSYKGGKGAPGGVDSSSSTSRRSTMTSKLLLNARSAAETRSSKRSLSTRLQAL